MRRSLVKASLFALFITQSQAATLEIQGSALVDKGAGFIPASNNVVLDGGDRVRATKGCSKIIYENGYRTKVCNGQLAVVFSTPPEVITNGSLKDTPTVVVVPDAPDAPSVDLLPAGILLATGIGAAVAAGSNGGDSIRSPGDSTRAASP
jgi:hypothetical protein